MWLLLLKGACRLVLLIWLCLLTGAPVLDGYEVADYHSPGGEPPSTGSTTTGAIQA